MDTYRKHLDRLDAQASRDPSEQRLDYRSRDWLPEGVEVVHSEALAFLAGQADEYDRVLLIHVIEHLNTEDGIALLSAIRRSLRGAGKLVVEAPNMSCIASPHMLFSDVTHKRACAEFSLTQALIESGYDDIRLICRAPNLELRQWRPWRPAVGTTLGWRANRMLHRFVYRLTDMGPGANCFCPVLLMTAAGAPQ